MNDMVYISEIDRCQPWIEAALEYSGGTHNLSDVIDIYEEKADIKPVEIR